MGMVWLSLNVKQPEPKANDCAYYFKHIYFYMYEHGAYKSNADAIVNVFFVGDRSGSW